MQHPLADKGRTAVPPSPTGGKGNTWGSGRAGHAGGQVPGCLHLEHTEVRVLPSPYPHPGPSTTTIPLSTADPDGGFVLNVEDASYDGSTPVSKTGSGGSIPPASVRRTNRCSPQKAPSASLRRIPGRSQAGSPSSKEAGLVKSKAPLRGDGSGCRCLLPESPKKGAGPGTSGLPRNSSTVLHVRP